MKIMKYPLQENKNLEESCETKEREDWRLKEWGTEREKENKNTNSMMHGNRVVESKQWSVLFCVCVCKEKRERQLFDKQHKSSF